MDISLSKLSKEDYDELYGDEENPLKIDNPSIHKDFENMDREDIWNIVDFMKGTDILSLCNAPEGKYEKFKYLCDKEWLWEGLLERDYEGVELTNREKYTMLTLIYDPYVLIINETSGAGSTREYLYVPYKKFSLKEWGRISNKSGFGNEIYKEFPSLNDPDVIITEELDSLITYIRFIIFWTGPELDIGHISTNLGKEIF